MLDFDEFAWFIRHVQLTNTEMPQVAENPLAQVCEEWPESGWTGKRISSEFADDQATLVFAVATLQIGKEKTFPFELQE